MEKVATLEEIETHWSIDDLFDANAILDFRDAAQASELRKIKDAGNKGRQR